MSGIKSLQIFALGALALSSTLFAAETTAAKSVTFHKDITPIFQEKCQDCHRKNSMAPMSLVTYEETRPWAKSIKQRVASRQMPPWHMDRTVGVQKFMNDRSLNDDQIATIVQWVDAGAPAGDVKDAPVAKVFDDSNGWKLKDQMGEPDFVVSTAPYTVPKVGMDQWHKPYSDIPVTEERWVRAVEMRPATVAGRKVTHHVLAYLLQNEGTDPAAARRNALAFTDAGPVKLRNAKHKRDPAPLMSGCDCECCRNYSRAYLHHLFNADEMLGPTLLSLHNLAYYLRLMREARVAIVAARFAEFAEERLQKMES